MHNSGFIAERFMENSNGYTGSKQYRGKSKTSLLSQGKMKASNNLYNTAQVESVPVTQKATQTLLRYIPELQKYVMSKGEIVEKDPLRLALQAVFLRADEIAKVSDTLKMDDEVSIRELENAESKAIEGSTADGEFILGVVPQACIDIFLKHIAKTDKANGFSGSMSGFCNRFRSPESFVGEDITREFLPIGYPSVGGSHLGNVSFPDNLFGPEDLGTDPATTTATPKGGFDLSSIIDSITKAVGSIGGLVGQVKDTSGSVIGQVRDVASDVGSDSITKAIKRNLPMILIGVAVVVLIIILIVNAAKRK